MKINFFKEQTTWSFMFSIVYFFRFQIFWCFLCFSLSLFFKRYIIASCFSNLLAQIKLVTPNFGFHSKGCLYYAVLLICSSTISVMFMFLGEYSIGKVRAQLERKVRVELFHIVQKYDMSFFQHSRGEGFLENSIDCIAESVSVITDVIFTKTCPELMLTLIILFNFFQTNILLCLASVSILLICSYIYLLTNNLTTSILGEHTQVASERANKMIDSFKNQFVKRIFGLENAEKKSLDGIHKRETKLLSDAYIYGAYIDMSLYLVLQVIYKSVFILFLIWLYKDNIAKHFSLFFTLLQHNFSLVACISSLFEEISEIRHEFGQFDKSLRILQQGFTENKENDEHVTINKLHGNIEFRNLDFSYGSKKIFSNFSMTIPKGSSLAIVGTSGSGKSTLLNLLSKIHHVNNGSVFVDGHDINTLDTNWFRKQISYITQSNMLFNDTILNNIGFGNLEATRDDIVEAAKQAELHDTIMKLPEQYDSHVGISGNALSGGQIQRICIARALLRIKKGNNIILCDEPISALDKITAVQLTNTIKKISQGHTTIIVDHTMHIAPIVDKVLFVNSHTDSFLYGTHQQLIETSEVYRSLLNV